MIDVKTKYIQNKTTNMIRFMNKKNSIKVMAQLTTHQRVFVVNTYQNTKSYAEVKRLFTVEYPDRPPLSDSCIWKNTKKFNEHGTILNLNAKNSGRRRTGRSEENINFSSQVNQY